MTIDEVMEHCDERISECIREAAEAEDRAERHHHRSLDYQKAKTNVHVARATIPELRRVLKMLETAR